jgi:lipoyl(octanoyl) transferase|tara:strand:+ start:4906 stop:5622 length:717 start_codon:yes stop_codon:yes gene_type:complete
MKMKNKKIQVRDIGKLSFSDAWQYQEKIFKKIIDQKVQNRKLNEKIPTKNFLILTEHNHVYTIGKSGQISNLLIDKDELIKREIEFFKINRGGDITYHGPGQIMGYPIFDLDNFFTDINLYLRKLESVIINTLETYNLTGFTIKGETGVWVKDKDGLSKKICAFGIRASRWVTMHGLCFNVDPDLGYFNHIIPCGIKNKGVTSLKEIKKENIDINEVKLRLVENFKLVFNAEINFESN